MYYCKLENKILTSFTFGTFMIFLAWLANSKVLRVSLWDEAAGDTAATMTVWQFPPKQSFKIHVRACISEYQVIKHRRQWHS